MLHANVISNKSKSVLLTEQNTWSTDYNKCRIKSITCTSLFGLQLL